MSESADTSPQKPHRLLPEPLETSSHSSKKARDGKKLGTNAASTQADLHIPEPGKSPLINGMSDPMDSNETQSSIMPTDRLSGFSRHINIPSSISSEKRHLIPSARVAGLRHQTKTRRFTPQLMETARHSYHPVRRSASIDSLPRRQTRDIEDIQNCYDQMEAEPGVNQESSFSYASLLRRQETRRRSFRVPELPAIPSSGSEISSGRSSPEQVAAPLAARPAICPDDKRHSRDNQANPPLELNPPLPPYPSEAQLKEHALAAFPNEQVYQPVDHFAIDMGEEQSAYDEPGLHKQRLDLKSNRRASSADLPSELEHLRRHKEEAGMNRRHYLTTRGGHVPCMTHQTTNGFDEVAIRDEVRDKNRLLAKTRQAASPPMLGSDLAFPQSLTPETTMCEGFFGGDLSCPAPAGLWNHNARVHAQHDQGGLWNGTCKPDRHSTAHTEALLMGLVTPRRGVENDACLVSNYPHQSQAPSFEHPHHTSQGSRVDLYHSDNSAWEFNDRFVSQIYDYLSLGYPSVARYYDHELSKVSGLPIAALRADDLKSEAKGHVGIYSVKNESEESGACMRWLALRLYIQEWARWNPQMLEADRYHEGWGVSERKGSWAV